MTRVALIWLTLSLLGAALIVALPDDMLGSKVLFSLSDNHGPSPADAIGLAFVLAGWGVFLRDLWTRRGNFELRRAAWGSALAAMVAMIGCIAAFAADQDILGVMLGVISLAAQLWLSKLAHRVGQ